MGNTNTAQNIGRYALGIFLVLAGIGHLSFQRTEFAAQVPPWLPLNPDLVVLLSGGVEILLGLSLLFLYKQRTKLGWIAAFFLYLFFPAILLNWLSTEMRLGLTQI